MLFQIKRFEELPPRARRIRMLSDAVVIALGTTSACAENTVWRAPRSHPRWNYLRVRGEYPPNFPTVPNTPELPPRARRIR